MKKLPYLLLCVLIYFDSLARVLVVASNGAMSSGGEVTVLIIGAGLSGLTAARSLVKAFSNGGGTGATITTQVNITILEARDRAGGRIVAENHIDLGPAWTWRAHDRALSSFVKELVDEEKLSSSSSTDQRMQYEVQPGDGMAIMQRANGKVDMAGYGQSPCGEGGYRFKKGTAGVISKVLESLQSQNNVNVRFSTRVDSLEQVPSSGGAEASAALVAGASGLSSLRTVGDRAQIKVGIQSTTASTTTTTTSSSSSTSSGNEFIFADYVIVAVPPPLVYQTIAFTPKLSAEKGRAMASTPIWMENTGKVAAVYDTPFWKNKGMSGTVFSERGPLQQIWDNSSPGLQEVDADSGELVSKPVFALTGFVFGDDLKLLESDSSVRQHVLPQLVQIFGEEAAIPSKLLFRSWYHEKYTSVSATLKAKTGDSYAAGLLPSGSLAFGHPLTYERWGNVVFASTETVQHENGHMNGAVLSGQRAAKEVLSLLSAAIPNDK